MTTLGKIVFFLLGLLILGLIFFVLCYFWVNQTSKLYFYQADNLALSSHLYLKQKNTATDNVLNAFLDKFQVFDKKDNILNILDKEIAFFELKDNSKYLLIKTTVNQEENVRKIFEKQNVFLMDKNVFLVSYSKTNPFYYKKLKFNQRIDLALKYKFKNYFADLKIAEDWLLQKYKNKISPDASDINILVKIEDNKAIFEIMGFNSLNNRANQNFIKKIPEPFLLYSGNLTLKDLAPYISFAQNFDSSILDQQIEAVIFDSDKEKNDYLLVFESNEGSDLAAKINLAVKKDLANSFPLEKVKQLPDSTEITEFVSDLNSFDFSEKQSGGKSYLYLKNDELEYVLYKQDNFILVSSSEDLFLKTNIDIGFDIEANNCLKDNLGINLISKTVIDKFFNIKINGNIYFKQGLSIKGCIN